MSEEGDPDSESRAGSMRANKPAAGMSRDRGETSVSKVRDQANEALRRRTAGDDSAETPKAVVWATRGEATRRARARARALR